MKLLFWGELPVLVLWGELPAVDTLLGWDAQHLLTASLLFPSLSASALDTADLGHRATAYSGCWVVVRNTGKGSEGKERDSFFQYCLLWFPGLPLQIHQSVCVLCFLMGTRQS